MLLLFLFLFFFFFNDTATTEIYTLSLHDALPICSLPDHYRGAPALVRDSGGRVRCVACQLCEFICPPRAIKMIPGEIPPGDRFAKVEKFPQEFDIDMIRCIYCGMCEEVCPEQA